MAKWGTTAINVCNLCGQAYDYGKAHVCHAQGAYFGGDRCVFCGAIKGEMHRCHATEQLEAARKWNEERSVKPAEGRKDDSAKPRYDLIPPEWLDGPAQVLTFGAAKYEARNWEKGMRWGRPFAAMMRHMWAWWRGEKADPETGYSHLWHAACCLMFLMAYEARSIGEDDRPC